MVSISKLSGKRGKLILLFLLIVYSFLVVSFTVIIREQLFEGTKLDLFWSYKEWISGDSEIGKQIIGNICLFIPIGFLGSSCSKQNKTIYVVIFGICLTVFIEVCQYLTMRGLFEYDDIIDNTIGTLIGVYAYKVVYRYNQRYADYIAFVLGLSSILSATVMCISTKKENVDSSSRNYCFQIESVIYENGQLEINGFAIWFDRKVNRMQMALETIDSHEKIPLDVEYGLVRADVEEYFSCEYDYSKTGFKATGFIGDRKDELQVLISLDWPKLVSTGVYIKEGDVYFSPLSLFLPPQADSPQLSMIIKNGILRDYIPQIKCWIYQDRNRLYWIFEKDSPVIQKPDATIQFQLWTTRVDKLPEYRLKNGWDWDERSGLFVDYEIKDLSDNYRVMSRSLPEEYPIKAILTGDFENDEWIWKSFFRPIYYFDIESETQ